MKKLNIRGKLMLMVIPLEIVILVLVIFFSSLANSISNESKSLYYDQLYSANSSLISADRDFYQAYTALLEYLTFSQHVPAEVSAGYTTDFEENMTQTRDRVNEVYAIVKQYPELLNYESDGVTIQREYDMFTANYTQLRACYAIGEDSSKLEQFDVYFNATRGNISNIEDLIVEYAEKAESSLEMKFYKKIINSIILVIISVLAITVVVVGVIRYLRKSIVAVADSIVKIANKDLTGEVPNIEGKDEIAQLSQAAIILKEQFTGVMNTLNESSNTLLDSSAKLTNSAEECVGNMASIDNAAGELARTASQQAEDTTRIASEMNDIDAITKESIDNTSSLADACDNMEKITNDSMKTVNELTDITNQSMAAFNNIFESIQGIDEKTQTIGAASDMISNIAMQTNLLSLNASIEAARAGDAGRGFAVVADEIRKLAEQSAESVETINAMIEGLSSSANEAKAQSDLVKDYVKKQEHSVEETKKGFDEIVNNLSTVNNGVDVLKDVNNTLGKKVNLIVEVVENLSAAAEETAATAQELSATTATVTHEITELNEIGKLVSESATDLDTIVSEYQL